MCTVNQEKSGSAKLWWWKKSMRYTTLNEAQRVTSENFEDVEKRDLDFDDMKRTMDLYLINDTLTDEEKAINELFFYSDDNHIYRRATPNMFARARLGHCLKWFITHYDDPDVKEKIVPINEEFDENQGRDLLIGKFPDLTFKLDKLPEELLTTYHSYVMEKVSAEEGIVRQGCLFFMTGNNADHFATLFEDGQFFVADLFDRNSNDLHMYHLYKVKDWIKELQNKD